MESTKTTIKPERLELNPAKRTQLLKEGADPHKHHRHQHGDETHHHHHTSAPVPGPEARLPIASTKTHPTDTSKHPSSNDPNPHESSVYFIGNATTVIEWQGIRILTDPNFLHAGDHVHLGPGVTAERLKNPAVDIDALPPLDCILLSHYHEDHFDRLVEDSLNRYFPIVSTPHAKKALCDRKEDPFRAVYDLDFFESLIMPVLSEQGKQRKAAVKVTGMPGKHVPPGPLSVANDLLGAVPPTNGWMIELGFHTPVTGEDDIETGYRIYISGDTLMVDELKEIPSRMLRDGQKIDLMLVHLGGTTIPGPHMPLLMVTMDGKQGVQLMRLMDPDVTIPVHFDDYSVMLSGLDDFKKEIEAAGFQDRVVYLDRGDQYRFRVLGGDEEDGSA